MAEHLETVIGILTLVGAVVLFVLHRLGRIHFGKPSYIAEKAGLAPSEGCPDLGCKHELLAEIRSKVSIDPATEGATHISKEMLEKLFLYRPAASQDELCGRYRAEDALAAQKDLDRRFEKVEEKLDRKFESIEKRMDSKIKDMEVNILRAINGHVIKR